MTSPITAVVSQVAAQATHSGSGASRTDSQAQVGPEQLARLSAVAAERVSDQATDEKRVLKRGESRAEAGFAPPKKRRDQTKTEDEGPKQKQSLDPNVGRRIDISI